MNFVFNGRFFKLHHRYSIEAGTTSYLQVIPTTRLIHLVARQYAYIGNGPVQISLLEEPTITNGTTQPTIVSNMDRRSERTATSQWFTNPTGISGGTLIDRDIIHAPGVGTGQSVRGGEYSDTPWERIIKPDTSTVIAINNQGDNAVDFILNIFFYESDN